MEPQKNNINTYSVNGKLYAIPQEKNDSFLKSMPNAAPVYAYEVNGKKLGIPKDKVSSFLKDVPNAKALYDYPDLSSDATQAAPPATDNRIDEMKDTFKSNPRSVMGMDVDTAKQVVQSVASDNIAPIQAKTNYTGNKNELLTGVSDKITQLDQGIADRTRNDGFLTKAFSGDVDDTEYLARNLYNKSLRQAQAVSGNGGTGVGDALKDRNFWTLGATDLTTAVKLKKVANKIDNNEPLTKPELLLLDAWRTSEEVNRAFPVGDAKQGYQVGKSVADMIPWLVQFAATRGTGTAGRQAVTQSLLKGAEKYLGKKIGSIAAKGAGEVAGAYAASALMPQTYTGIIDRSLGQTTKGPNGNIGFDKNTAEKPLEAIYKGWTSGALEVLTERLGEGIEATKFYQKLPKARIAERMFGPAGKRAAENFGKFTKAVGWNGAPLEYLEEWVNIPANAILVGDSEFKEMFNGPQQLTTFLTVLAMGKAMGITNTAMSAISAYGEGMRQDREDAAATKLFNDNVPEPARNQINDILNNPEISVEQQGQQLFGIINGLNNREAQGAVINYISTLNRWNKQQHAEQVTEATVNPEQPLPTVNPADTYRAEVSDFIRQNTHNDGSLTRIKDDEDNEWFVSSGQIDDADGMLIVYDPNSPNGKRAIAASDVQGNPEKITPDEFLEAQMQRFAQQEQVKQEIKDQSITINGQPYLVLGDIEGDIGLQPIDETGQPLDANPIMMPKKEFEAAIAEQQEAGSGQSQDPLPASRTSPNVGEETASNSMAGNEGGEQPSVANESVAEPAAAPRVVNTVKIGKNNYKYTTEQDGRFDIQLEEGQDPAKAEKEIRATLPDDQQHRVQLTQNEVEIPSSVPWVAPKRELRTTGITILPENTPVPQLTSQQETVNNLENNSVKLTETNTDRTDNQQNAISGTDESLPKNETTTEQGYNEQINQQRGLTEGGNGIVNETVPDNSGVILPQAEQGIADNGLAELASDEIKTDANEKPEEQQPGTIEQTEQQVETVPEEQGQDKPEGLGEETQISLLSDELQQAGEIANEKESVQRAEAEVNTNPTEGQKEAGNYKKGHARFGGFDITIENPKGSTRSGKDQSGKPWSITMNNNYGYFKRTLGKDGDQIDVFLGLNNRSQKVYVVDQIDPKTMLFDEHKVMLGFNSEQEAREAYLSNFSENWPGLGAITEMKKADFKKWLGQNSKKKQPKRKPVSKAIPTRVKKQQQLSPEEKKERKENKAKALAIEPVSLEQHILQYIVRGNRLNRGEIKRELFPRSKSEMNKRFSMLKNDAHTIDELLVKDGAVSGTDFEQEAMESNVWRNAVLNVVLSNSTPTEMVDRILEIGEAQVNDIEQQENKMAEAMMEAERLDIANMNEAYAEMYAEMEKNGELPSEDELNNLFLLDYGTEENINEGTVSGENGETDGTGGRADRGKPDSDSPENPSQLPTEERSAGLEADLKRAQQIHTTARNTYNKLNNRLKNSPEFGNKGQADIFGNLGGADMLDFGSNDLTEARKAVADAKAKMDEAGKEVSRINKAIENIRKDEGQVGMFAEESKPDQEKGTWLFDIPEVLDNSGFRKNLEAFYRAVDNNPEGFSTDDHEAKIFPVIKKAGVKTKWGWKDGNERLQFFTPESKPDQEYEYNLRSRPFGTGTFPTDNFVRFEEDGTPFGKVIYSEKLPVETINKFELVPIGQVKPGSYLMVLGKNRYPINVELIKTQKGHEAVKITSDENKRINQNLSVVEFHKQLNEGRIIGDRSKPDQENLADRTNEAKQFQDADRQEPVQRPADKQEPKFLDDAIKESGKKTTERQQPKRKSLTDRVKKNLNKSEAERLDELRNRLRNKLGGQLNAGLDPETFMMAAEATGLVIKSGARAFSQYASTMVDMLGEKITPHLKALYEYTRRADSAEYAKEMTPTPEVDNADIEQIIRESDENFVNLHKENDDVSDRSGNSESSSSDEQTEVQSDGANVSGNGGGSRSNGNGDSQSGRTGNRQRPSSQGSLDLFTPVTGERSTENEQNQPESESTRNTDRERGQSDSATGDNVEQEGDTADRADVAANTPKAGSFAERVRINRIKQQEAEGVPVKVSDRANISETLPFLLEDQQDDVFKTEKRFNDAKHQTHERAYGKGMLFTNGTGTGKTYTGLGIVKRFAKQGKDRILIVVPTQPKVTDWIKDGRNLDLTITALKDTKDKGTGIVITTYANMRANLALLEDDFDLVMYDESHRLMEDKKGSPSSTTYTHYNLTNKTEGHALMRLQEVHPLWLKARELERKIRHEGEYRNNPDLMDLHYQQSVEREEKLDTELKQIKEQKKEVLPALEKRAAEAYKRTKVVFLSATPFKMHFNLRYANGYLFDWGEEITYESASRGMSRVDPESRFFLDNFGGAYEWKYHRLQQKSDANPEAIAMQEVEFSEKLMKQGVMSGRAIESDMDYSREFPKVALANADLFNRGFNDIYKWGDDAEFDGLRDAAREVFYNYNYTTKLFESLKTSMSIPRIQQHIDLGRKVVVFHRRRQAGVTPPFKSILALTRSRMNAVLADKESDAEQKQKAKDVLAQCDLFAERYSDLLDYELTLNYNSAIDQVVAEFGTDRVRLINGNVSKKDKNQAVKDFNDDESGVDIIMVQEESGKEGISLHDTSGKHQRALISLSMPISSITALQIEGRIFRIGNESNAIFEYPLLGLDLEVAAFGQSINRKLSTTENLAVGNQSRDLLRSFAEGVLFNSTTDAPNQEQGKGGKEYDKKELELKSEFQRAKLVYSTNQKQRGRRDQRKGVDYYPTPEPVGQKMVEWLGLREGDEALEPSAGHGAIAMWFPSNVKGTVIEPSFELFSKLTARTGDAKKINTTFEEHNVINKYDGVVMNPPFGQGGSTAIKHIEKAYKHLRPDGRIVALIPNGGSMQKKFDKFLYGEDEKGQLLNPDAYLVAEMVLPAVTFEQAGTAVNGKIVVIDKLPVDKTERQIRQEVRDESNQQALQPGGALMSTEEINQEVARRLAEQRPNIYTSKHDFTSAKTIDELFDNVEYVDVTPRMKPFEGMQEASSTEETSTPVEEVEGEGEVLHPVEEYEHTKTGAKLYNVRVIGRTDRFKELANIARKHSPYNKRKAYSPYAKGFLFSTKEHAVRFRNEVEGRDEQPAYRKGDISSTGMPMFSFGSKMAQDLSGRNGLDEKHEATRWFVNQLNEQSGNIAETQVVKALEELPDALAADGATPWAVNHVRDNIEEGSEIFGLEHNQKVYIVSETNNGEQEIAATWLHENTHVIVAREFTNDELTELYDNVGEEYVRRILPDDYHNRNKATQANELLAFTAESLTANNRMDDILSGNIDFNSLPLSLQFALHRVTGRFKEYGTNNSKRKQGRGNITNAHGSTQGSSREIPRNLQQTPKNGSAESTGSGQKGSESRFLSDLLYSNKAVPQTETPEFKRWFGNSKVVDENGEPLVVYHGTPYVFNEFSKKEKGKRTDHKPDDVGFHFSNDPKIADTYAGTSEIKLFEEYSRMFGELPDRYSANVKPNLMPVYLSIQNPLKQYDSFVINKELIDQAKKTGHDGIFAQVGDRIEYVAFEPTQIKSATGNNGGFDPDNADIRFKKKDPPPKDPNDSNFLADLMPEAGKRYAERETARNFKEWIGYVRQSWQDKNLPIRKLEEAIKERGGRIWNKTKPYRDINLSFGRMERLYRDFHEENMVPVLEAISELVKASGINRDYIIPYIYAKHAEERNKSMRMEEFDRWLEVKEADGEKVSIKERNEKLDELDKKDYSGVSSFSDEKINPDDLANMMVEEFEQHIEQKYIDNLWEAVSKASGTILDHWLKGGQISPKQYNHYKIQYKYFVPLRGWRHGLAKQLRYHSSDGFGRSLRHAEGRTSLADNPLSNMEAVAF